MELNSKGGGRSAFPAFPYAPYDIQLGFMQGLYSALDQGGVGLFESPTGTGKTLSLICGSLHWLQDRRRQEAAEAAAAAAAPRAGPGSAAAGSDADDDAPDWMLGFAAKQEAEEQERLRERQSARIARQRAKMQAGGRGGARRPGAGKLGRQAASSAADGDSEVAEFLLEEVSDGSDGEAGNGGGSSAGGLSSSARKRSPGCAGLRLGGGGSSSGSEAEEGLGEEEEVELLRKRQVIFVSRTHSQLSQFVRELHRTPFADDLSLVALGSRKALCINDTVLRLQAPSLINERCLELQKPGASSSSRKAAAVGAAQGGGTPAGPQRQQQAARSGRCPFLAGGSQAAATTRDMILAQPLDIEELSKLGRRKSVCPYYSARRALPEADVVLAPYSCLLVKETREALGLKLEGNVVIVDEAHNLVDAINGSHSAELSAGQAATAQRQLDAYFARFQHRLAPANCRHVQMLLRAAQALSQAASGGTRLAPSAAGPRAGRSSAAPPAAAGNAAGIASSNGGSVLTVNDFLLATGLDNVNLFKLISWVRESKAVHKVAGFWQSQQKKAAGTAGAAAGPAGAAAGAAGQAAAAAAAGGGASEDGGTGAGTGALHALVGFLQALTNADADGRIVVQPPAAGQQQAGGANAASSSGNGSAAGSSGGAGPSGGQLKFVLLNAAAHFGSVVSAAHAVVLASGTLSPLESVMQLFPGLPAERLHRFACGHVVGQERLLALAVGSGPSGAALDFRHASRAAPATMDELGRLVLNACQVVPGGVVVFFPSFSYADQVHSRWQQSGVLRQLGARKRVFREPRSAGEVEACLQEYADCIEAACSRGAGPACSGACPGSDAAAGGGSNTPGSAAKAGSSALTPANGRGSSGGGDGGGAGGGAGSSSGGGSATGAVMLCVVGGKLAEGINFGDSLGRCVIVVGLPYPNPSDPELKERMAFMDRLAAGGAAGAGAASAAAAGAGGASALRTPGKAGAAAAAAGAAAGGPSPPGTGGSARSQQTAQVQAALPLAPENGREYYSNLCMKAVNQCVGRVIRHRGDWAAVLLVDARYAAAVDGGGRLTGPLAKLPGWVQRSLQVTRSFGDVCGRLARFSRAMAAAEAGGGHAAAVPDSAPAAGV